MSWFVVRTKPNQEFRAQENLDHQGFETYLPTLHFEHKKPEPLFSGYLFLANRPSKAPFIKVRSTRGVLSLVRFGSEIAVVKDELISVLKQNSVSHQNLPQFKAREAVRIKTGPFAQLNAIYLYKSGADRAMVLLNWLNRTNHLEMTESALEKI